MAQTWHPVEIELRADDPGENPYGSNLLSLEVEHASGTTATVPGFWDGDDVFRSRFVPSKPGTWSWRTTSSDPGLQATGTVDVDQSTSELALHRHGYLQPEQRVFTHADGTPFFWLGDTAWTASSRASLEEWERYLDFRDEQGYSVIQINALRQHDGSRPHDRLPFGEDWDLSTPNHAYFQHLDEMVAMCHERGIVPALVALWFDYVPGANVDWGVPDDRRHEFSPQQARTLGRYLGARYGAYGATWLVSGDSEFNEQCVSVYREAGEALGDACQYPLRTAHQPGSQSTPTIMNEEAWLDYHMYQSGHTRDLEVPERQAIECRVLEPARPVLNGEPCYAEMQEYSSDALLEREVVRAAGWLSVLSGGNAGVTYGVLGIWPWHRDGDTFEAAQVWGEPNAWDESLEAASGEDYSRIQAICAERSLETLSPRTDLIAGKQTGEMAAVLKDSLLVYLATGREITLEDAPAISQAQWMDPATGARHEATLDWEDTDVTVSASEFDGDALLIAERV